MNTIFVLLIPMLCGVCLVSFMASGRGRTLRRCEVIRDFSWLDAHSRPAVRRHNWEAFRSDPRKVIFTGRFKEAASTGVPKSEVPRSWEQEFVCVKDGPIIPTASASLSIGSNHFT